MDCSVKYDGAARGGKVSRSSFPGGLRRTDWCFGIWHDGCNPRSSAYERNLPTGRSRRRVGLTHIGADPGRPGAQLRTRNNYVPPGDTDRFFCLVASTVSSGLGVGLVLYFAPHVVTNGRDRVWLIPRRSGGGLSGGGSDLLRRPIAGRCLRRSASRGRGGSTGLAGKGLRGSCGKVHSDHVRSG